MFNNLSKGGGHPELNNTHGGNFWRLRNKNDEYEDVVAEKRPISPKFDDFPELTRTDSPDVLSEFKTDSNEPFIERYNSINSPQTLLIDKNCANCNTGFAP